MEILDLALFNFRNFSAKKLEFERSSTVILGPNGSGKSNILEAIGFLSGVRSKKVQSDLDLVKFGRSEAKVEGKIGGDSKLRLTINWVVVDETHVKKAYFVDLLKKRFVDFIAHLSMVIFEPEDLELVAGSPSDRRHHIDSQLCSIDRDYWRALFSYNKVLVRRNRVLARINEAKAKPQELDFWDGRLLEHGMDISKKRQEYFEFLNASLRKTHLFGSEAQTRRGKLGSVQVLWGEISWELKQSLLTEEKLASSRGRDIEAQVTLSGPHRDDFRFIFRKRDLAFFGSRGEQRMAVLALKLSELEYRQVKLGSRPILALDDIFSELDWEHRQIVLAVADKQQTIITAAEPESVPKQIFKKAKVIELK